MHTRISNTLLLHATRCLLISVGVLALFNVQAQRPEWARNFGGPSVDRGSGVAVDQEGSIFFSGDFSERMDADPGPDSLIFETRGDQDICIGKLDSAGNLVWAGHIGGPSLELGGKTEVDAFGNVYVTGMWAGTADLHPGNDSLPITSKGINDIFVCKLSNAGDMLWVMTIGGTSADWVQDLHVDAAGNFYVSGYFRQTADFDPGPDSLNLTAEISYDAFVAKYTSDGELIWARVFHDQGGEPTAHVTTDMDLNVYVAGGFAQTADFDPDTSVYELTSQHSNDMYLVKLNVDGQFLWAKHVAGYDYGQAFDIIIDDEANIYVTGTYGGRTDFDPDTAHYDLISVGGLDAFIAKYDSSGVLFWARGFGSTSDGDYPWALAGDPYGNVYSGGYIGNNADLNPDVDKLVVPSAGSGDMYIVGLDKLGNFNWATLASGGSTGRFHALAITDSGKLIGCGLAANVDFDPGQGSMPGVTSGGIDLWVVSYPLAGIRGSVYSDPNQNCIREDGEADIRGIRGIITPGDILFETDENGFWHVQALPAGDYTAEYWPTVTWTATCPIFHDFTVVDPNTNTTLPAFGMHGTGCTAPEISVFAPRMRRCMTLQSLWINACNLSTATLQLDNPYVILELDTFITVLSSSVPAEALVNNTFRLDLEALGPGECIEVRMVFTISCDAVLGQTLCMRASLFPADTCVYDAESLLPIEDACDLLDDRSHLMVEGSCLNDSIYFLVTNSAEAGTGDMQCFSSYRVFLDGKMILLDSVKLAGGESHQVIFTADGRTYRLEIDQHPQHPGRSSPNATVERCGNPDNWTPDLINLFAADDEDVVVDEYCGVITGSYDPNDKQAFPGGVTEDHHILPNRKLNYVIRFQNTGTDTAFTIVIRDTIDTDLNVLNVRPGVASHSHQFRVFGSRVLEWTFDHIILPDSTTDLQGSNGFVSFVIDQEKDLPDGTEIHNSASIYFDYNEPVKTNTTMHTVDHGLRELSWIEIKEVTLADCNGVMHAGIVYNQSGTYYQILNGGGQGDTLVTLYVDIALPERALEVAVTENVLTSRAANVTYQWYDCLAEQILPGATDQSYEALVNGSYAVIITNGTCSDTSLCRSIDMVYTEDAKRTSINLYPNPSEGEFHLIFDHLIPEPGIRVFDFLGKELESNTSCDQQKCVVKINSRPGVYALVVSVDAQLYWMKVIVQ
ncbi:MAG TPA: T9SS type A sorting domain-containing protein [Saprospiraceae bacterium]|nr:T9SS type A sorting domain-containing protein [Saprospiraceae bacterium]